MKRLLFLAAIGLAGAAVWWTMRTQQNAPMQANASEGAQMVQVALPDRLGQQAGIGKTIFDAKCADCHGAAASGRQGIAPPLVHKIYEPSHHADESFQLAVSRGVRAHHWSFGNMPAVEGLTRGDVAMVIAYIRSVQRTNGIH